MAELKLTFLLLLLLLVKAEEEERVVLRAWVKTVEALDPPPPPSLPPLSPSPHPEPDSFCSLPLPPLFTPPPQPKNTLQNGVNSSIVAAA